MFFFSKIINRLDINYKACGLLIILCIVLLLIEPSVSGLLSVIFRFAMQFICCCVMFYAQKDRVFYVSRLTEYLTPKDIDTVKLDSLIVNSAIEVHLSIYLLKGVIELLAGKESTCYAVIDMISLVVFIVFLGIMIYDYTFSRTQKILDKILDFD